MDPEHEAVMMDEELYLDAAKGPPKRTRTRLAKLEDLSRPFEAFDWDIRS